MTQRLSQSRTPRLISALLALGALALPSVAQAGGYDTPMLYSARHMGMGGAAAQGLDAFSASEHAAAATARSGRERVIVLEGYDASATWTGQSGQEDLPVAAPAAEPKTNPERWWAYFFQRT